MWSKRKSRRDPNMAYLGLSRHDDEPVSEIVFRPKNMYRETYEGSGVFEKTDGGKYEVVYRLEFDDSDDGTGKPVMKKYIRQKKRPYRLVRCRSDN